ncbi:MAG: CotH protein, partial [Chthoniobacteraceae bacterium]|nr:CotH protein [Chthoniobacteraceae bacterium]
GGKTLNHPLFPGSAVTSFDSLRMRSGKNDISNPFVRDELTRRLFIDTGNVGVHGINATLWINGVYKGFYNPVERPRQAFFQNWYHSEKEWDVWVINDAASGDNLMLQELVTYLRSNPQSNYANYQGAMARLDVANFIDYLLINLYEVMGDWPHNNYIMARERSSTGKWVFTVWDGEGSFGSFPGSGTPTTRTNQFATAAANSSVQHLIVSSNPAAESLLYTIRTLYTTLRASPEFKLLFADRIQKHFFNGGALTDAKILARKNALRDEMLPLIPSFNDADFNTWINGTGDITRYTTAGAANNPSRRQVLLNGYTDDTVGGALVPAQFRAEGLFPATLAPVFSQSGGQVAQGFQVAITNPNATGTIYHTTDGSDPRAPGGAVQGNAYSTPIPITQTSTVKARIRNANNEWSPVVEFTFVVSQAPSLLITEIMYHPAPSVDADGDQFEFVELKNVGPAPVNLAGMSFGGITYTFPAGAMLAPDAFALVVSDSARFGARYPGVTVAGVYAGSLDNSGEAIILNDLAGNPVTGVTYSRNAPWPALADGYGNSLVPINPNSNPLPNNAASWRASATIGGSPGADDATPAPATVVVNELLSNSVLPQTDTVELYNPTSQGVDVGGWFLSDNANNPKKYRIADGTIVSANGYLVFNENDFNANGTGFTFDGNGEEVRLSAADAAGNLTGYSHGFSFGASNPAVSFGRYINSAGIESFPAQLKQTFGAINAGPLIGPVVISELMYQPALNGDEFVELRNNSNLPVALFDTANPLNTWKLTGIAYPFPAGITLEPRQIILVTSLSESAWRGKYNTPTAIRVYGPYAGNLDNGGERVSLQMPGVPYVSPGGQNVTPYITVDSVDYSKLAPWPTVPGGTGPSLERLNLQAYADDPGNWQASPVPAGTPGSPVQISFSMWQTFSFSTADIANPLISSLTADPDGDGISNLREFAHGLNPLAADASAPVSVFLATDSGSGPYLTIHYRRSLAAGNLTFQIETATLPGNWFANGTVQLGSPVNNGDGTETITARDTEASTEPGKRFIRLRVIGE